MLSVYRSSARGGKIRGHSKLNTGVSLGLNGALRAYRKDRIVQHDLLPVSKIVAFPGHSLPTLTFDKDIYPRLARALSAVSKSGKAEPKVTR